MDFLYSSTFAFCRWRNLKELQRYFLVPNFPATLLLCLPLPWISLGPCEGGIKLSRITECTTLALYLLWMKDNYFWLIMRHVRTPFITILPPWKTFFEGYLTLSTLPTLSVAGLFMFCYIGLITTTLGGTSRETSRDSLNQLVVLLT